MTRRRWIADEVSENHAALIGPHADHLARVLRAQVGQEFDVVADAVVRRGRIISIAEGRVAFELGEEIPSEVTPSLTLLLAIFKFDRMEWSIEKCTELGATKIIPVFARRTDARLASAAVKRVERWRRIAIQASEQSRRPAIPEIASPSKLGDVINIAAGLRIVLAETETERMVREVVTSHHHNEIALAIGPEGGWTEDELDLFEKQGWISASLGPTILRAETAAIAAVAIALS
jgi:16S rRNA (uracil1498-N3)-methyltransferase